MILTMTHMFDYLLGRYSLLSVGDDIWWVMERQWLFNRPEVSCVPRDEYELQPHDGSRYKDTYALVGDGVSHGKTPGIPRYACVLHAAHKPQHLKGCIAPAMAIDASGYTVGSDEATAEVLQLLSTAQGPIKILMQ